MLSVPDLNLGSIDAINYTQRRDKEFLAKVFLRDSFLDAILDGRKYFLIGEKGTGKTAYAVLLNNTEFENTRSSVRNVTATDYTKFISLQQSGHLKVSQYVDTWKVILLLLSAHHLIEREGSSVQQFTKFRNLKAAIDSYYKSAFAPEVIKALEFVEHSELVAKLLSQHLEVGGKVEESTKVTGQGFQTNLLYIEREMREAIASLKLSRNQILFIDGIDIRPSGIDFATYIECIRGLAHAAWSLNTDFFANIRDSKGRMKVVLLLRPDIFNELSYQNQNAKARDNGIILDWRTSYQDFPGSRIFHLIDGLLGKQQPDVKTNRTGAAWNYYFPYELPHRQASEKVDNAFIGFLRYSFYRPRDIVSYLLLMQEYVKLQETDKATFTEKSFRGCQSSYSDYLLGEVRDHLSFYYSNADFDEIIGFFKFMRGQSRFGWPAFVTAYDEYKKSMGNKKTTVPALNEGPESFMQFLYSLNVIGYDEKSADDVFVHWCFRDRTPVTLNPKVIVGLDHSDRLAYWVHAGLARALRVGSARN